jgi:hypothetical protein
MFAVKALRVVEGLCFFIIIINSYVKWLFFIQGLICLDEGSSTFTLIIINNHYVPQVSVASNWAGIYTTCIPLRTNIVEKNLRQNQNIIYIDMKHRLLLSYCYCYAYQDLDDSLRDLKLY